MDEWTDGPTNGSGDFMILMIVEWMGWENNSAGRKIKFCAMSKLVGEKWFVENSVGWITRSAGHTMTVHYMGKGAAIVKCMSYLLVCIGSNCGRMGALSVPDEDCRSIWCKVGNVKGDDE